MAKKPVKQTLAKDEAKPQQPLEKQVNPKAKPFVDKTDTQIKYRYACQFCTNVAFLSPIKRGMGGATCQSCGKVISELKAENYIEL